VVNIPSPGQNRIRLVNVLEGQAFVALKSVKNRAFRLHRSFIIRKSMTG
jgi:hypothetical protein